MERARTQGWMASHVALIVMLLYLHTGVAEAKVCQNEITSHAFLDRDIAQLTKTFDDTPDSKVLRRAELSYLIVLAALAEDNKTQAGNYLERGLELLQAMPMQEASSHALSSLLYGQKLRMKPYMGMFIGSKPKKHLEKASQLGGNLPLVRFARASFYHHTPKSFGGSLVDAAENYRFALRQAEAQPLAAPCWLVPLSQAELIRVYRALGDDDAANSLLQQNLREYPVNQWRPGMPDGASRDLPLLAHRSI